MKMEANYVSVSKARPASQSSNKSGFRRKGALGPSLGVRGTKRPSGLPVAAGGGGINAPNHSTAPPEENRSRSSRGLIKRPRLSQRSKSLSFLSTQ